MSAHFEGVISYTISFDILFLPCAENLTLLNSRGSLFTCYMSVHVSISIIVHKIFAHKTAVWPNAVFDILRSKAEDSFMWQKGFGDECQSLVAANTL